jgi:hypothetical protein
MTRIEFSRRTPRILCLLAATIIVAAVISLAASRAQSTPGYSVTITQLR